MTKVKGGDGGEREAKDVWKRLKEVLITTGKASCL